MARSFRVYGKKRGDRRTGSSTAGKASEGLFFATFLALGLIGFALLLTVFVIPEWRVNNQFAEHTCTVLDKRLGEKQGEDGTLYRAEIKVRYRVDGDTHSVWTYDIDTIRDLPSSYTTGREAKLAVVNEFVVGQNYLCWYNPTNPAEVVLVHGYRWWIWVLFVVPFSFIVIGLVGGGYALLSWGKSAEHQAAIARRVQQGDPFVGNGTGRRQYPNIPIGADITNSPGTTLEFRLPIATASNWALFGIGAACVFWNGIVAVFATIAVRKYLEGQPDWVLSFFVVPFAVMGVGLILLLIRQLLITTGVGPTFVEVSQHPLQPGDKCRLFVSQTGRLQMKSLRVLLVCDEEATYRQGTDTRTETREVFRKEVYCRDSFSVQHGLPFETDFELQVPPSAMHSFKSAHNEVNWRIVVLGDVAGWPDYQRSFPVIVQPRLREPS